MRETLRMRSGGAREEGAMWRVLKRRNRSGEGKLST